jgi:flagellin-like protein
MKNTKKRGVSPVIATVILVAIAIVVSIAAAFWMTGLLSSFTAYERLTLSASISKTSGTPPTYTVTVIVTNDGTLPTKVEKILINGVEPTGTKAFDPTLPCDIDVGETKVFVAENLGTTDVGNPRSIVKITVVTSRGTYETQLTVP